MIGVARGDAAVRHGVGWIARRAWRDLAAGGLRGGSASTLTLAPSYLRKRGQNHSDPRPLAANGTKKRGLEIGS